MVFDFTGNNPCVDGDCTTANDWYESRLAEPDVLLEDLVNIITPEAHPVRRISSKASSYALPFQTCSCFLFWDKRACEVVLPWDLLLLVGACHLTLLPAHAASRL